METRSPKYRFKEGEAVCHIDNLELKMNVERVVFSLYPNINPETKESTPSLRKILGIKVHWFEGTKLHKAQFHKHLLVPFDVVSKAQTFPEIQKWMKENNS